jgi:uroporphyrinogen decarboxylase
MDLLADTVIAFLLAQLAAGAQVLQLFDSWVGALGPYDYERFAAPWSRKVLDAVGGHGAPVIHFANGASAMLPQVRAAGGDVIGLDWRIDLDHARDELGEGVVVQGNLDPVALLGPIAQVEARAADVLGRAHGLSGHIFNLGHGLLPQTPPDTVARLVAFVHDWQGER